MSLEEKDYRALTTAPTSQIRGPGHDVWSRKRPLTTTAIICYKSEMIFFLLLLVLLLIAESKGIFCVSVFDKTTLNCSSLLFKVYTTTKAKLHTMEEKRK